MIRMSSVAIGLAIAASSAGFAYADHLNIDVDSAKIENGAIVSRRC